MKTAQNTIGYIGLAIGAAALLLAVVHFWAGPFSPQPTVETAIADKVVSIRDTTLKALKGEEYRQEVTGGWNADKITEITIAVTGALAIILGLLAFIKKAPQRLAGSAVLLGAGAIGFQMFTLYVGILLAVLLIWVVLSSVGLDFSF